MAFDGFTVAALTSELSQQLTDGRLQKIAQPEADDPPAQKTVVKYFVFQDGDGYILVLLYNKADRLGLRIPYRHRRRHVHPLPKVSSLFNYTLFLRLFQRTDFR